MSEKRVLRKMKKLASRIHDKMEAVRDVMDDLEIEFELLQKQITKLESKKGLTSDEKIMEKKSTSHAVNDSSDESDSDEEEDDEDLLDLENTSVVTGPRKFWAKNEYWLRNLRFTIELESHRQYGIRR